MKTISKYKVDTKDTCLLCLRKNGVSGSSGGEGEEDGPIILASCSLNPISRFLNFDYANVFKLPILSGKAETSHLEETEMIVPLCINCSPYLQQIGELYKQLEIIKLKLNACVKGIHDVMRTAEDDTERYDEYQNPDVQLEMTRNPVKLMNATVADNLRKEINHKCSSRLKSTHPTVQLTKMDVVANIKAELKDGHRETSKDRMVIATTSEAGYDDQGTVSTCDENVDVQSENDEKENNYDAYRIPDKAKKKIIKTGKKQQVKSFQCNICPASFACISNLKYHQVTTHLTTYFSTIRDPTMPPKQFQSVVYRLLQKYDHQRVGHLFICAFCPKKVSRSTVLRNHLITVHLEEFEEMLKKTLKFGLSNMASHSKTVKSKKLRSKIALTVSTSRKNKKLGSKCSMCHKIFSCASALYVHKRVHTGVKPYKCSDCPLTFRTNTERINHLTKWHLGNNFKDVKDSRTSTKAFNDTVAAVVAQGVKRFKNDHRFYCRLCPEKYANHFHCKYHLIQEHKQELVEKLQAIRSGVAHPNSGSIQ